MIINFLLPGQDIVDKFNFKVAISNSGVRVPGSLTLNITEWFENSINVRNKTIQ